MNSGREVRTCMTKEEPTAAYVLSLIGGIFVLLGGILIMLAGGVTASIDGLGVIMLAMGFIGLILGVTIIIGAVIAYNNPDQRSNWGIGIIILSILSIILSLGGFIIGFVLSLIGGILFVTWKPTEYAFYGTRMCMVCGRYFPSGYGICPHCGSTAPPPEAYYYPQQPVAPQQQWAPPPQYPQQAPPQQPIAPPPPLVTPPPTSPPGELPCPNCGEVLPTDIRFCPKCGTRLRE